MPQRARVATVDFLLPPERPGERSHLQLLRTQVEKVLILVVEVIRSVGCPIAFWFSTRSAFHGVFVHRRVFQHEAPALRAFSGLGVDARAAD